MSSDDLDSSEEAHVKEIGENEEEEKINRPLTEKTVGEALLDGALIARSIKFLIHTEPVDKVTRALFGFNIVALILQIGTLIILGGLSFYNYDNASDDRKRKMDICYHVTTILIAIISVLEVLTSGIEPVAISDASLNASLYA